MVTRHMLGAEEAQRAIDAMVGEAEKDKQPMSIAVADSYGEMIACFRMDGSPPRVLRHSIRKAYTSGIMHRGTLDFKAQFKERDSSLDEWGDQRLTTLQGGMPVRMKGEIVGAVGVGGNSVERDTEICKIAIAAIGLEE
jgi:glc operon protein GlcG